MDRLFEGFAAGAFSVPPVRRAGALPVVAPLGVGVSAVFAAVVCALAGFELAFVVVFFEAGLAAGFDVAGLVSFTVVFLAVDFLAVAAFAVGVPVGGAVRFAAGRAGGVTR